MINVYIASGPSGAGKTFQVNAFARIMHSEGEKGLIVSADHFWSPELGDGGIGFGEIDTVGVQLALKTYNFVIDKISEAHGACMRAFVDALQVNEDGKYSIIVDNTNIYSAEIAPYYLVGEAFGAKVEILRVEADVEKCIERTTHEVPEDVIRRMHTAFSAMKDHPWEEGVTLPEEHMPWWNSRTL